VLAAPTILALSPQAADSRRERVRLSFESQLSIQRLARLDTQEGCCLDPAGEPPCSSKCRAECRIYTPGRENLFRSPLLLDDSGAPSCPLPTYLNSQHSCSGETTQLEVEVLLDSYFVVPSLAPWLGCLPDTVVVEPSGPQQVLY